MALFSSRNRLARRRSHCCMPPPPPLPLTVLINTNFEYTNSTQAFGLWNNKENALPSLGGGDGQSVIRLMAASRVLESFSCYFTLSVVCERNGRCFGKKRIIKRKREKKLSTLFGLSCPGAHTTHSNVSCSVCFYYCRLSLGVAIASAREIYVCERIRKVCVSVRHTAMRVQYKNHLKREPCHAWFLPPSHSRLFRVVVIYQGLPPSLPISIGFLASSGCWSMQEAYTHSFPSLVVPLLLIWGPPPPSVFAVEQHFRRPLFPI